MRVCILPISHRNSGECRVERGNADDTAHDGLLPEAFVDVLDGEGQSPRNPTVMPGCILPSHNSRPDNIPRPSTTNATLSARYAHVICPLQQEVVTASCHHNGVPEHAAQPPATLMAGGNGRPAPRAPEPPKHAGYAPYATLPARADGTPARPSHAPDSTRRRPIQISPDYRIEYDHENGIFGVFDDKDRILSEFSSLRAAQDYIAECEEDDADNWLVKHHPRSDAW